jgi:hypothetical protein
LMRKPAYVRVRVVDPPCLSLTTTILSGRVDSYGVILRHGCLHPEMPLAHSEREKAGLVVIKTPRQLFSPL